MLSELEKIPEVNKESLLVYARLWQLEKWLREMVYIELKSKKGRNWMKFKTTENKYEADKKLQHMPTSDKSPLSYLTFSELTKYINNNWELFSMYLPPQNLWEAKLEEVVHIRNRIAHYRKGHSDDLNRLLQLMRDIDNGFWRFCTSYNNVYPILPQDRNAVTKKYFELDPFAYKQVGDKEWAMFGTAPESLRYMVSVNVSNREWAEKTEQIDATVGYIYDVKIIMRKENRFDYKVFLERTVSIHSEVLHFCLDAFSNSIRVTIPAKIGNEKVIEIIDVLIEEVEYSMTQSGFVNTDNLFVQALSEEWPEYVLGPKNPLTFLDPSMTCSFFNV